MRSLVSLVSLVFHVFTVGRTIGQLSMMAMLGYTISTNVVPCQTAVEFMGGEGRFPLSLRPTAMGPQKYKIEHISVGHFCGKSVMMGAKNPEMFQKCFLGLCFICGHLRK